MFGVLHRRGSSVNCGGKTGNLLSTIMTDNNKRDRKANFSDAEIRSLLKSVLAERDVIQSKLQLFTQLFQISCHSLKQ